MSYERELGAVEERLKGISTGLEELRTAVVSYQTSVNTFMQASAIDRTHIHDRIETTEKKQDDHEKSHRRLYLNIGLLVGIVTGIVDIVSTIVRGK